MEPFSQPELVVLEHWGLEVLACKDLPGEYDANFRVTCSNGADYVFKVMHSSRSAAFLDLQTAVLAHLSTANPALCVPVLIPTLKQAPYVALVGAPSAEGAGASSAPLRYAWLLAWQPGVPYALAPRPYAAPLMRSLGAAMGALQRALQGFSHPAARKGAFKWDLTQASWVLPELGAIADAAQRALVSRAMARFSSIDWTALRRGCIHADLNDYNVLTSAHYPQVAITGVLDFGDMHESAVVCDLAIAGAYAVCGNTEDPLAALVDIVQAAHGEFPLTAGELCALPVLVAARLCVSVVNSALRKRLCPGDAYIVISEKPAWAALEALEALAPLDLAAAALLKACGSEAEAAAPWLQAAHCNAITARLIVAAMYGKGCGWGGGAVPVEGAAGVGSGGGASPHGQEGPQRQQQQQLLWRLLPLDVGMEGSGFHLRSSEDANSPLLRSPRETGELFYAPWGEVMLPEYTGKEAPGRPLRTLQLGLYVFCPPGTAITAPLEGTVASLAPGVVVLEHSVRVSSDSSSSSSSSSSGGSCACFFARYSGLHFGPSLSLGQRVAEGALLGQCSPQSPAAPHLRPHLHLQLLLSPLDFPVASLATALPYAIPACSAGAAQWLQACPSPVPLLGASGLLSLSPSAAASLPASGAPLPPDSYSATLTRRRALFGGNVRLSYSSSPLKMARARGAVMLDHAGTPYLDCYNNVPSVGHCHPTVTSAATAQLRVLNTNSRYLHDTALAYAQALLAHFPPPLNAASGAKVYLVNSASEANELALRLARTFTRRSDVVVLEEAYHGNTGTCVDCSPYKFLGPGGTGRKPWVHVAPVPDSYRGAFAHLPPAQQGAAYARAGAEALCSAPFGACWLRGGPAAFLAESAPSVAGQLFFPPGFLAATYAAIRGAGGVCIADEVQTGFGRLAAVEDFGEGAMGGGHVPPLWGFLHQGVVPDIVVLGKPVGNGFPLGVVVARGDIGAAFDNGMEYFSTFGGNPVAAAAGLATLRVLLGERLVHNSAQCGAHFLSRLRALAERAPLIGEVRGRGLFLGVELVHCRASKVPCNAGPFVQRLREKGVLAGTEGPFNSVIKLRPPLCFTQEQADFVVQALGEVLEEAAMQPQPGRAPGGTHGGVGTWGWGALGLAALSGLAAGAILVAAMRQTRALLQ